nr:hypothetical protein BgiMline_000990 [Biomphalaria glabrata]
MWIKVSLGFTCHVRTRSRDTMWIKVSLGFTCHVRTRSRDTMWIKVSLGFTCHVRTRSRDTMWIKLSLGFTCHPPGGKKDFHRPLIRLIYHGTLHVETGAREIATNTANNAPVQAMDWKPQGKRKVAALNKLGRLCHQCGCLLSPVRLPKSSVA